MMADIQIGELNSDLVRSLSIDALPTSENGWPLRPFQIVSLFDMIEFGAVELFGLLNRWISIRKDLEARQHPSLTQEEQASMHYHSDRADSVCAKYDIDVRYYTERVRHKVDRPEQLTYTLAAAVNELRHCVTKELKDRKFMYMSLADAEYYDHGELFGPEVKAKFPKANGEITIAGNCYATGNYTACVFHLMRAVEITARAMVRALGASKYLTNQKGKQIPVELCDWWTLVSALQKGLDDLSAGTGTSRHKKRKFEHYSHAVASFRNFKDAWRNHVSHTRELYAPGKTKDIIDNTRQFMTHLAVGLKG